jgi:CDP-glucose 4,6-dehydratase
MNTSFWHGRKVFLTGHTGFKGSWLSLWLQHMGAEVTGYALPAPTTPSMFELAGISRGMVSVLGDIREPAALQASLGASGAEVVFHLAAQPLVRQGYAKPVETYATNVLGTVHVLEAVRQIPSVLAVIIVTSDKCYENREWVWGYRENEPMGGFDPYSSSKACAELVTSAYRRSFFDVTGSRVSIASARAGNVIGGGDWADDRLIPDLLRALARGQALRVRNPNARRPWQHVLEPLSGYLTLAQRLVDEGPRYARAWNFGPCDDRANTNTVQELVERLVDLWGHGARWELDAAAHPHEASQLRLDSTLAQQQLGWSPKWDLDKALTRVVDWHKAHIQGHDMRQVSLEQIKDYMQ